MSSEYTSSKGDPVKLDSDYATDQDSTGQAQLTVT